jgi:hypothetical protein
MAIYKFLVALPVVFTALFIQACSDRILNPSESANSSIFEPTNLIDLGVESKGSSSMSQSWVFGGGVESYRFAQNDKNPVDLSSVTWKLERLNPVTQKHEGVIASSENGDKLYGKRFKILSEIDMLKFSISTKDGSPLRGAILAITGVQGRSSKQFPVQEGSATTQSQKDYKPIYTLGLRKDFKEETFMIDGEVGNYIVEVQTNEKQNLKGIKVVGAKEGETIFSNFYNGEYNNSTSYRNQAQAPIAIKVSRDTDDATLGVVRVYFKPQ